MAARDKARKRMGKDHGSFKALRNKVVKLVKRDRAHTVSNLLRSSKDQQSAAWGLAKNLMKPRRQLPILDGATDNYSSACSLNRFYVDKMITLRSAMPTHIAASKTLAISSPSTGTSQ